MIDLFLPMATENSQAQSLTRNAQHVVLGNLRFQTWYQSIYPEDLVSKDTDTLYVCQWCFRYSCDIKKYASHTRLCPHRTTPPGTKVYDHAGYSVWEVDGADHKLFGQNLSLFAKLFLDHKSVFFDVVSFLYYILVFTNPNNAGNDLNETYHILGFFSKEKLSWDANNLACILVFPPYQHKQLGKLLMGISYKISGWERDSSLIGGPEKPLSEMGSRSYTRFWEERIARYLLLLSSSDGQAGMGATAAQLEDSMTQKPATNKGRRKHSYKLMTVQEIGRATGMLTEDVITALRGFGIVEPATPSKTRKGTQSGPGESEANPVVIRRSKVLEWIKAHNVSIRDPVREEGFLLSQSEPVIDRELEIPGSDDDE
ncbi:acyl-CoA N-acyltransferase [Aspergillus spinulosporus]